MDHAIYAVHTHDQYEPSTRYFSDREEAIADAHSSGRYYSVQVLRVPLGDPEVTAQILQDIAWTGDNVTKLLPYAILTIEENWR